jgi:[histone H3]-lysine9 N-trimethyltransferase SUV39H
VPRKSSTPQIKETEIISLSASDSDESVTKSGSASSSHRQSHSRDVERLKQIFSIKPKQREDRQQPRTPPQPTVEDFLASEPVPIPRSSQNVVAKVPSPPSKHQSPVLSATNSLIQPLTPKFSGIEVIIPKSERKSLNDGGDILAKLGARIPNPEKDEDEKKALLDDLIRSSEPIKTRLNSIERLFGLNGLSDKYSTVGEIERLQKLAQRKARKVKRKDVALDFGVPKSVVNGESEASPLIHPSKQIRDILNSKFNERVHPPLTFSNDVDARQLNGKFQFISAYILREKVWRAGPGSNYGCSCIEYCDPTSCECLGKDVETSRDENGELIYPAEVPQTYMRRQDGLVVLADAYLDKFSARSEITECNHLCGCDQNCLNRVVQKGRTVPLDIFQTEKCGFGVRSSSDIARGQFIELYLGEVITQTALRLREAAKDEHASSYVFTLDWWNEQPEHYHIDGENFGSAMRFVNHSCNANSKSFAVQLEHHADKRLYCIAFFAIRDISAGEEITIDYNPQLSKDNEESQADSDALDEDTVLCQCNAPNCRIRLWPKAKTQRKRRRLRD